VCLVTKMIMIQDLDNPDFIKIFDFRSNLIVDQDNPILIQKAWRDHFAGKNYFNEGKDGGKAYLGVLHGEDAMTWNVFRSLQKEGQRGNELISDFFGLSRVKSLLFWGCDVESSGEEQQRLSILIRILDGQLKGTMTEPDLVVIAEKEVAFIECKLNKSERHRSPWKAQLGSTFKEGGASRRMEVYKKFGFKELQQIDDWPEIYQLVRQYLYAKLFARSLGKMPVAIPLINEDHLGDLKPFYAKALNSPLNKSGTFCDMVTWQDLRKRIAGSDLDCKEKLIIKMDETLAVSDRQCKRQVLKD